MATPLTRGAPIWLARQSEHDPLLNKHYRRSVRYYRKLYAAWPLWAADDPGFKPIYDEAKANLSKSNKWWPDHPFVIGGLFDWHPVTPHQMALI